MHVLITGGAGFIGGHSAVELITHGHSCTIIDDLSTGSREALTDVKDRIKFVKGSILDQGVLEEVTSDCAAILHLAAQVSVVESLRNPVSSATTNVLGFIKVLEAAQKRSCRLVYASSAAVYGGLASKPCHESDLVRPRSPYGLEKSTCEAYARLYSELYGLSSLALRYFNVYGPGQPADSPYSAVIPAFVQQVSEGKSPAIYGDGLQTRDFIEVTDVARANRLALESEACGVLNVGSGTMVTLLDLVSTISTQIGRPITPSHLPARPADVRMSVASVQTCGGRTQLQNYSGPQGRSSSPVEGARHPQAAWEQVGLNLGAGRGTPLARNALPIIEARQQH
jgi:UDP-glucose 4-epimerase